MLRVAQAMEGSLRVTRQQGFRCVKMARLLQPVLVLSQKIRRRLRHLKRPIPLQQLQQKIKQQKQFLQQLRAQPSLQLLQQQNPKAAGGVVNQKQQPQKLQRELQLQVALKVVVLIMVVLPSVTNLLATNCVKMVLNHHHVLVTKYNMLVVVLVHLYRVKLLTLRDN